MITIAPLTRLTKAETDRMGFQGYTSDKVYNVDVQTNAAGMSITFTLAPLEKPYVKYWKITDEDLYAYRDTLRAGHSFGAFEEDTLVGFVICEQRDWNNTMWVESLLVAESARGAGIGKLLLAQAISHAAASDCRHLELETQNTNVPAVTFYLKNGFALTGVNTTLYDPSQDNKEIAFYLTHNLKK
ncbi:GNAT family N-acetyltransferase [Chitinophaga solisilvae]|uniref:GNAT family N-acetyltransferase n=1 Tax=Chitinophaga solisilvae TaxID=1233460 RepID=UPI00136EA4A6|nr:GNAT family N-acetyltransferase [Chitinophaga solisilvae]